MSSVKIEGWNEWSKWIDSVPKSLQKDIENEVLKAGYSIERVAKSKTPVDTGRLKGSIHTNKKGSGKDFSVEIGTDVDYAPHVEYGTINQAAQPFLNPAFEKESLKVLEKINQIVDKELS